MNYLLLVGHPYLTEFSACRQFCTKKPVSKMFRFAFSRVFPVRLKINEKSIKVNLVLVEQISNGCFPPRALVELLRAVGITPKDNIILMIQKYEDKNQWGATREVLVQVAREYQYPGLAWVLFSPSSERTNNNEGYFFEIIKKIGEVLENPREF